MAERLRSISTRRAVDFASPVFIDEFGGPIVLTRHILVRFRAGVDAERAESVLADVEAGEVEERDWGRMRGAYRVRHRSRNGFDVLEAANRLAERPEVIFAEPDVIFTGHGTILPNDPLFFDLWNLHNTGQYGGTVDMDMDIPEAWDITSGDPSVIVVVIDTGVEQTHPDINQIPGTDSTNQISQGGGPITPFDFHGTMMAGCVAGIMNNGLGAAGTCPGCKVASARTMVGANISGAWSSQTSWTVASLAWAESIGASVTNNSNNYGGLQSAAIAEKYRDTRDAGIIHFASTNNAGTSSTTYPARLPSVVTIGAVDRFGQRAFFSNYGPGLAYDAPGIYIGTTDRTGSAGVVSGDYLFRDGTSFSSAQAAGVAGLVASRNPVLGAHVIEQILQDGCVDLGDPGYDTNTGWGFLNALNAVQLADPAALGACCNAGDCSDDVTAAACQSAGGGDPGTRWFGGEACSAVVCPAPNGRCENAIRLVCNGSVTLDNSGIVNAAHPLHECGIGDDHDGTLWFRFTASESTATVQSCVSAGGDTTISVYGGTCDNLQLVDCAEDNCGPGGNLSAATFDNNLTVGETYYVQVSSWTSEFKGSYSVAYYTGECCTTIASSPGPDPDITPKNRYLSIVPPNVSTATAIRVKLVVLQNPNPPNAAGSEPLNYDAYENQVRWVGPPQLYPEATGSPSSGSFMVSALQCEPYFNDWSDIDLLYISGAEIIPSSIYDLQLIYDTCSPSNEQQYSFPLGIGTARWGDVIAPFSPPSTAVQPDFQDVSAVVDKFKSVVGAPKKARSQLQPAAFNPMEDVSFLDISACVDAFKGAPYPYIGFLNCGP